MIRLPKKLARISTQVVAHGLLMNHLSLGVSNEGALRVIFDTSDSMGKVGGEVIIELEDEVDLLHVN